jgi:hypothetical protein
MTRRDIPRWPFEDELPEQQIFLFQEDSLQELVERMGGCYGDLESEHSQCRRVTMQTAQDAELLHVKALERGIDASISSVNPRVVLIEE